jgi:predicted Zn-dependent protease
MRNITRLVAAAPLAAVLSVAACNTVSGTNRSQFNMMSEANERKLGEEAYAKELANVKKVTSGADDDRVQRVGKRIQEAAGRLHAKAVHGYNWQWTVIDDEKTVNAWSLPGGRSAVYTGILRMCKTDDELAVVMGHEASHAIARHTGERISSDLLVQGALEGTSIALTKMSPAAQQATLQALGMGTQVGVILPWSRMQESEADELGLMIAADAGYDPRQSISLWQRMASQGGAPPEFLSTHPSDETRVKRLEQLMPRAMKIYDAAQARMGTATGTLPVPAQPRAATNAATKPH